MSKIRWEIAPIASLLVSGVAASAPDPAQISGPTATPFTRQTDRKSVDVHPRLRPHLVAHYDFEHPVPGNPAQEQDQGFSGTYLELVNGGPAMRVADGAHPGSSTSIQTRQVNPMVAGNDDWKAGTYSAAGAPSLRAFNQVRETTIMGWFKMTGQNPSPNSNTASPDDFFGAIGLAGILSGDSDGHAVRALLELINVNGVLRLVALGRRIDGRNSQTFAASEDWRALLPDGEWVFLAATFDFETGTMALYRNGEPLDGFYVRSDDPWEVAGPGPHYTSPTDPKGIKIGGSFPQNTRETNPCNCRMDSLMFLDRTVNANEVRQQYRFVTRKSEPAGPITDPIAEGPIQSNLGLIVEEFAAFPGSAPVPPPTDRRLMRHARINYIGEIPDGSGRMFVPDLNGRMYLVENGVAHVYLDIGAAFAPQFFSGRGLGQGFGFVTFDPDFSTNGTFYTVHTELASATTKTPDLAPQPNTLYHGIVTEWTAEDPTAGVFQGTRREILRIGFGGQIHGIQQIDFNPTAQPGDEDYGLLYIAIGDGGQGVRTDHPQNLAMPHGKLFRIDPQGRDSSNGKYGIPATNPWVGKPGVLGEIFAVGMRDPHRFSWDPGPGHRMFLGHIGEHAIEAIYEVRAGDNFGWSEREGAFVFDKAALNPCHRLLPLPANDEVFGYTYPLAAYDHDPPPTWNCTSDIGRAVVGGFVYRGHQVPELRGKYIFGDIVDGRIFFTRAGEMHRGKKHLARIYELALFDTAGKPVTMQELAGDTRVDLRFGRDGAGELYLLAKANGKIWKIVGARRDIGTSHPGGGQ
jgi:Glucose / Sorbosone dehydrogenase/Concanavalin A-like lectin/glucanases superfamily